MSRRENTARRDWAIDASYLGGSCGYPNCRSRAVETPFANAPDLCKRHHEARLERIRAMRERKQGTPQQ